MSNPPASNPQRDEIESQRVDDCESAWFAGADVGGTNIKIGIVDNRGKTIAKTQIPTEESRGPKDAMKRIAAKVRQLASDAGASWDQIQAIGLATPGTMDIPNGIILQPHNLPNWWNYPARDQLAQQSGKPVSFANDANAAAFGEYWVGTGIDSDSIVMLTLGTGLGGGVIIHDLSIDGEHSHGSECGHTIIDCNDDARLCGCGQRGHLEAYVSANAVVHRTEEALAAGSKSTISDRLASGDELTPLLVAQEADAGDSLAEHIVIETGRYLGIGVVNMMHLIDPGIIVLGGAMNFGGQDSALGQRFLERVRTEVAARAFPTLIGQTRIEFASLGGNAGYIGAAAIARSRYLRDCL